MNAPIPLSQFQSLATEISKVEYLEQLLNALREDAPQLRRLAKASYRHENGFYKLTISDDSEKPYKLRLHYWPAGRNLLVNAENIHSHRFNCHSHILTGTLINQEWKVASEGETFCHYRYYPRRGQEAYQLIYLGEKTLLAKPVEEKRAGIFYHMSADDLHTSVPAHGNDVVTLFLTERVGLRDFADVFTRNPSVSGDMHIDSPSLSSDEYVEIFECILAVVRDDQTLRKTINLQRSSSMLGSSSN